MAPEQTDGTAQWMTMEDSGEIDLDGWESMHFSLEEAAPTLAASKRLDSCCFRAELKMHRIVQNEKKAYFACGMCMCAVCIKTALIFVTPGLCLCLVC